MDLASPHTTARRLQPDPLIPSSRTPCERPKLRERFRLPHSAIRRSSRRVRRMQTTEQDPGVRRRLHVNYPRRPATGRSTSNSKNRHRHHSRKCKVLQHLKESCQGGIQHNNLGLPILRSSCQLSCSSDTSYQLLSTDHLPSSAR